jgi:hypothetical protein
MPMTELPVTIRAQVSLTAVTVLAAVFVLVVRLGSTPLRMNDYEGFGNGQSVWQVSRQMLWVVPVPTFNQPVRIRAVELRTVYTTGQFDRPTAFVLQFPAGDYYSGVQLTTPAGLDVYAGGLPHVPLGKLQVQQLDNQLSIVVPVNIHQPGCHEAQLVFKVSTDDGAVHTLATHWYVTIDNGISDGEDDNMCARPRPVPTVTPSVTKSG